MGEPVGDVCTLLAFWSPGPGEMLLLAIVALLLYGGELPQVARSWGKSLSEFRRGLSGIHNDLNDAIYSEPERLEYHGDVCSRDDAYVPESDYLPGGTTDEPDASTATDPDFDGDDGSPEGDSNVEALAEQQAEDDSQAAEDKA